MAARTKAMAAPVADVKSDGYIVKHMLRPLDARTGTVEGLDKELDSYIKAGYRIAHVSSKFVVPEGPQANAMAEGYQIHILYILVKDQ